MAHEYRSNKKKKYNEMRKGWWLMRDIASTCNVCVYVCSVTGGSWIAAIDYSMSVRVGRNATSASTGQAIVSEKRGMHQS